MGAGDSYIAGFTKGASMALIFRRV
ncbi:MAG: hypothetical protein ACLTXI_06040 [Collinsella sp.]